jgi:hypothetical protein
MVAALFLQWRKKRSDGLLGPPRHGPPPVRRCRGKYLWRSCPDDAARWWRTPPGARESCPVLAELAGRSPPTLLAILNGILPRS